MNRMLNSAWRLATAAMVLTVISPAWAADEPGKDAAAAPSAATTTSAAKNSATPSKKAKKAHRDRGANQPGATGNRGGTSGRDAGANQPGAAGNNGAAPRR